MPKYGPKYDPKFEDALDYFYLSDSDDEYFSALEEQSEASVSSFFDKGAVRKRRTDEQRKTQAKLKQASTMSHQKQGGAKVDKRWRLETGIFVEPSSSRKGFGESKSSKNKLPGAVEVQPWTVDEKSAMIITNTDHIVMKKYNEFKNSIINNGVSPLDHRFESSLWDIKKTHQKHGFQLWSARLTASHRVTFTLNKEEHKVMICSVKKHA